MTSTRLPSRRILTRRPTSRSITVAPASTPSLKGHANAAAFVDQHGSAQELDAVKVAVRAAWIAAVAAVLAAIFAAGATVYTTIYSTDREEQRSQTEFLRSQRQALYAEIVNDDEAAYQEEVRLSYLLAAEDVQLYKNQVRNQPLHTKQFLVLSSKRGAVTVVGSGRVQNQMRKLLEAHSVFEAAVYKLLQTRNDGNYGQVYTASEAVNLARVEVETSQQAFFYAAQADIGNS